MIPQAPQAPQFTPTQRAQSRSNVLVEPRYPEGSDTKNPREQSQSPAPFHSAGVSKNDPNHTAQPKTLAEIEREAICAALDQCGGSPVLAAKQLEISTATIYRKIKIYNRR